jgi:hypothetical protein
VVRRRPLVAEASGHDAVGMIVLHPARWAAAVSDETGVSMNHPDGARHRVAVSHQTAINPCALRRVAFRTEL